MYDVTRQKMSSIHTTHPELGSQAVTQVRSDSVTGKKIPLCQVSRSIAMLRHDTYAHQLYSTAVRYILSTSSTPSTTCAKYLNSTYTTHLLRSMVSTYPPTYQTNNFTNLFLLCIAPCDTTKCIIYHADAKKYHRTHHIMLYIYI